MRLQNFQKMRIKRKTKPYQIPENWTEQLIALYIIRSHDGICLFSHYFQIGEISAIENQLIGMGFSAISKMMKEVVDSSVSLKMIDLDQKQVLIEEYENLISVLITKRNHSFFRIKLQEITSYFQKLFELQQQINLASHVCMEDYALTSDLVSYVFQKNPGFTLDLIPIIFKRIQSQERNRRDQILNIF